MKTFTSGLMLPLVVFITACSSGPSKPEYACEFYPQAPRPAWASLSTPSGYLGAVYNGIGFAERKWGGPREQRTEAINDAKKQLVKSINERIKLDSHYQLQVSESNNRSNISQDNRITAYLSSDALLTRARIDGEWLDRNDCFLWARVVIDVKDVNKMQQRQQQASRLYESFVHLLAQSQSADSNILKRKEYVEKARSILLDSDILVLGEKAISKARSQLRDEMQAIDNKAISIKARKKLKHEQQHARKYLKNALDHALKAQKAFSSGRIKLAQEIAKDALAKEKQVNYSILSTSRPEIFREIEKYALLKHGIFYQEIENRFGRADQYLGSWEGSCIDVGFIFCKRYANYNLKYRDFAARYGDLWLIYKEGFLSCWRRRNNFEIKEKAIIDGNSSRYFDVFKECSGEYSKRIY